MGAIMTSKPQPYKLLSTLSKALLLCAAITIVLPAQAELVIHNSIDASGHVQMTVHDDRQKELPPAQLGITPTRISETVSLLNNKNRNGLNQSLTLYNYGNKPKNITINLVDLDESGTPMAPSETTLKPWTLINPTQFTIPANGYQTVRMAIRLPIGFAQGSYKAMLTIEQQVDNALRYDADGKGVTVEIGSRYGLPIYIEIE